ncbi:MAG: T9SS type A sorting domain-containing protein [bacterium]
MKKILVISLLVLAFIMVFAGANEHFAPNMLDAKPTAPAGKDSMAAAAGGTALYWQGGAFSLFPGVASNIAYDTISGYVQVAAAAAYGAGDEYSLTYFASDDNGANWTAGVDLFPSNHSEARSLSCFAISQDGYPYAYANWRNGTTIGAFFVADPSGPNAGGWTSPVLIGDTINYESNNYSTITTNPVGDKVAFFGWNDYWTFSSTVSADYGSSWSTYTDIVSLNPDSNPDIWVSDISTVRWADGDNVYGMLGFTPAADSMAYMAGQGTTFGLFQSSDGGETYGSISPVFDGTWWPNVDGMGTDSFTYMMDTIDNEDATDAFAVQAWYDPDQGIFVDELGNIDAMGVAPGTWWHKWDMEYVNGKLHVVAPFQMVTVDYVTEGDLYTFTDYWDNIMYGVMDIAGGETEFTWTFCDVKCEVLDTLGNLDSYRGFQGSSQLSYDWRNDEMYVVYMDLYDTATGAGSHELLKIEQNGTVRRAVTPPLVNSNVSNALQAANIVDEDGVIHQIWRTGSADSIYYAGIDVDDVADWEIIYDGIENNTASNSNAFFSVPSIIRDNGEVSFSIANTGNVRVSLYDVAGREVMNLINKEFSAGTHKVNISANTLSQGVYFATIMTDNGSDSKKVIIVK